MRIDVLSWYFITEESKFNSTWICFDSKDNKLFSCYVFDPSGHEEGIITIVAKALLNAYLCGVDNGKQKKIDQVVNFIGQFKSVLEIEDEE